MWKIFLLGTRAIRGRENVQNIFALVCSLAVMGLISDVTSAPFEGVSTKVRPKRSPIYIDPSHLTNQHDLNHDYESTVPHHHSGELPLSLSTSSIKTSGMVHRGPSVSGTAVINLVNHEIVQTHDHPGRVRVAEDYIADLSKVGHAISTSKKTTVTTKVGHIVDDKGITPVVTHEISHTRESVAHVTTEDDEYLRVLPLHSVVISARRPERIVSVHHEHTTHKPKTTGGEELTGERTGKQKRGNPYNESIGGYGVGLSRGGFGAGHGYQVIYNMG